VELQIKTVAHSMGTLCWTGRGLTFNQSFKHSLADTVCCASHRMVGCHDAAIVKYHRSYYLHVGDVCDTATVSCACRIGLSIVVFETNSLAFKTILLVVCTRPCSI
jgi:hypothetical protein